MSGRTGIGLAAVVLCACGGSNAVGAADPINDVVVFTAHPDDESMYAGGTLATLRDRGHSIALVILSHGEGGRLLVPDTEGHVVENRSHSCAEVAGLRDREMQCVARLLRADLHYLFDATSNLDYGFDTEPERTLARWNTSVPGGLAEIERRLRDQVRKRRPAVVLTLDVRNDPSGNQHSHHRAIGMLVQRASANDPEFARTERWSFAPQDTEPDMVVNVEPKQRLQLLQCHASQFKAEDLQGRGSRPSEGFVLQRAGAPQPEASTTVLASWLKDRIIPQKSLRH